MADLAIWMAGHVSVPIYPSLRPQSIRQILEHSGSKACFVGATDESKTRRARAPRPGVPTIVFPTASSDGDVGWDALVEANRPIGGLADPRRRRHGHDHLHVGHHRDAQRSDAPLRLVRLRRQDARAWLGLTRRARALVPAAGPHRGARGHGGNGFLLGSRLFFTEGIDTFLADLHRARPTIFLSVPRLLLKFQQGVFAKMPQEKLDRLLAHPRGEHLREAQDPAPARARHGADAACGAAPLPTEILLWYRKLGLQLAEGYGMTETMITHLPRPDAVRPGYVGMALRASKQSSARAANC